MAELESLLQQEIPNGRKALLDSKANLENVANYCQQVYVDSGDKKQALDETKNFTTQSLASVAYQINTLASNMLHMLDIQAAELASMESSINNISMTVDVHKEKVARREIGLLTTNKVIQRNHQIVAPSNPDRPLKYVRKPIDYTELDDIGHGVKIVNQQQQQGSIGPRRASKTPSPSVDGRKRDSVTSGGGYGTIRAVRTPTVPTDYGTAKRLPSMYSRTRTNSNSSSGSGSISSSGGYYPGAGAMPPPPPSMSSPSMPPPPPMDSAPPPPPPPSMAPPPPPMSPAYSTPSVPRVPEAPSLPVPNSVEGYASTAVYDPLPPPPPSFGMDPSGMPPPPPPADDGGDMPLPPPDDTMMMPPPPPDDLPSPYSNHDDSSSTAGSNYGSSDPSWAPKEYLQKVIAIYDYSAENADELSLREDEIVYVVRKNDDGWYEGVKNGVTGLFPGNYVETISA